jgi:DNA ligase (NAD+)
VNFSEYSNIVDRLIEWGEKYYNQDTPEVSDAEYDTLKTSIKKFEQENPDSIRKDSPTQTVGWAVNTDKTMKHTVPMLSLRDVFDTAEVEKFVSGVLAKHPDALFIVEPKIDGISAALEYVDGKLVMAGTRGDSQIGEVVLNQARNIQNLPNDVSGKTDVKRFVLRGEVYMDEADLERINKIQAETGKRIFANPRNCAAGTFRQKDASFTKERNLKIQIFNVQESSKEFKTHQQALEYFGSLGFPVVKGSNPTNSMKEIRKAIDDIEVSKKSLPYWIDGAVVKVDQLRKRDSLKETSSVPLWAVAYKYSPEQVETVLESIELSVGRTGKITPVANVKPVNIGGSTVSKATLHNQDIINALDVRVGDTVLIHKAAEIIPEIVKVVLEKRPETSEPYVIPMVCPVCGHEAIREEGQADLRCQSLECPAQTQRMVEFFAQRECMDIDGLGPQSIAALLDGGYIEDVSDLYYLTARKEELIASGVIGKTKSVENLLASIEKSKQQPLPQIIKSLGIRNLGRHAGKDLADKYGSLERIMELGPEDYDELLSIPGFGDTTVKAVLELTSSAKLLRIVDRMIKAGVNTEYKTTETAYTGTLTLAGMTFVVTGTLPTMKRKDAEDAIERAGGKVSSSVSKTTNYLLAGEKAGSKLDKATKLGVPVITEEEFMEMI